jgi:hypothetical protein
MDFVVVIEGIMTVLVVDIADAVICIPIVTPLLQIAVSMEDATTVKSALTDKKLGVREIANPFGLAHHSIFG